MNTAKSPFMKKQARTGSRADIVSNIFELLTPRRVSSVQTCDDLSLDSPQTGVNLSVTSATDDYDMDEVFRKYSEHSINTPLSRIATCFLSLASSSDQGLKPTDQDDVIPDIRKPKATPEIRRSLRISQPRQRYLPFCTEYDGRKVHHSKSISGCIKDIIERRREREPHILSPAECMNNILYTSPNTLDTTFRDNPLQRVPSFNPDSVQGSPKHSGIYELTDVMPEYGCPFGVIKMSMKYIPVKKKVTIHVDSVENVLESRIYHKGFGVYVKVCKMPRNGAKQAKSAVSHNFVTEDTVVLDSDFCFKEVEEEDIETMAVRFQACQKGLAVNKCPKYLGETLVWMDEIPLHDLKNSVRISQRLLSYYGDVVDKKDIPARNGDDGK